MKRNIDEIYRDAGLIIKHHRTRLGMSQEQLASKLGLIRSSISNMERGGQRIPLHLLYRIAEALQLTLSDLVPTGGDSSKKIMSVDIEKRKEINQLIEKLREAINNF